MSTLRFEPFRDPFRELDRLASQMRTGRGPAQSMPMDVFRTSDAYHIALDVPGVDPSSIEVTVDRGSLRVSAERAASYSDADQVVAAERPQGQFTRELVIGDGVDAGRLQADYADGVLHLVLPVQQSSQPRRIQVTRAEKGPRQVGGALGGSPGDGNGEEQPRH